MDKRQRTILIGRDRGCDIALGHETVSARHAELTNSSLEQISHRLDLRYSMLRYLVWVIPTVDFIGTVIGISLALSMIDPGAAEQPLGEIAKALGIAFNTTLVTLVESAVLVLMLNLVQAREEGALNRAGNQTFANLINRLYPGGGQP